MCFIAVHGHDLPSVNPDHCAWRIPKESLNTFLEIRLRTTGDYKQDSPQKIISNVPWDNSYMQQVVHTPMVPAVLNHTYDALISSSVKWEQ